MRPAWSQFSNFAPFFAVNKPDSGKRSVGLSQTDSQGCPRVLVCDKRTRRGAHGHSFTTNEPAGAPTGVRLPQTESQGCPRTLVDHKRTRRGARGGSFATNKRSFFPGELGVPAPHVHIFSNPQSWSSALRIFRADPSGWMAGSGPRIPTRGACSHGPV